LTRNHSSGVQEGQIIRVPWEAVLGTTASVPTLDGRVNVRIKPTVRTETAAARLGCFSFDSSHRWNGLNKTASASAQAGAGKTCTVSR